MFRGEIDDASSFVKEHRARELDEGIGAIPGHLGECAVELVGPPDLYKLKLNSQGPCRGFCRLQHLGCGALAGGAGVPQRSDARRFGKSLLEQVKTLRSKLRAKESQPGDVPARPREAGHEAVSNRIAHGRYDNGDGGSCLLNGAGRWRIRGENEVDVQASQLNRQMRKALDLPIGRSVFDEDVLPLHIAVFAQSLLKRAKGRPRRGGFKRACN